VHEFSLLLLLAGVLLATFALVWLSKRPPLAGPVEAVRRWEYRHPVVGAALESACGALGIALGGWLAGKEWNWLVPGAAFVGGFVVQYYRLRRPTRRRAQRDPFVVPPGADTADGAPVARH
jgi:predicted MFS family arabinose efflux permease